MVGKNRNAIHEARYAIVQNEAGEALHDYVHTFVYNITTPTESGHYSKFVGLPDILDVVLSKNAR